MITTAGPTGEDVHPTVIRYRNRSPRDSQRGSSDYSLTHRGGGGSYVDRYGLLCFRV